MSWSARTRPRCCARATGRGAPTFRSSSIPRRTRSTPSRRTERKTGPGYKGFSFHAAPDVTLEDDLKRRDLTINAMARGEDGELVDPHGGAADLRAGLLRHVSAAFAEDRCASCGSRGSRRASVSRSPPKPSPS